MSSASSPASQSASHSAAPSSSPPSAPPTPRDPRAQLRNLWGGGLGSATEVDGIEAALKAAASPARLVLHGLRCHGGIGGATAIRDEGCARLSKVLTRPLPGAARYARGTERRAAPEVNGLRVQGATQQLDFDRDYDAATAAETYPEIADGEQPKEDVIAADDPWLRCLHVWKNHIGPKGACELGAALTSEACRLTELDLSRNPSLDIEDLGTIPSLTKLKFSNSALSSLSGIEKLEALESISIDRNALEDISSINQVSGLN